MVTETRMQEQNCLEKMSVMIPDDQDLTVVEDITQLNESQRVQNSGFRHKSNARSRRSKRHRIGKDSTQSSYNSWKKETNFH